MTHTDSEALQPLKPRQSRRQFCVHACQALSLVTVGAVLEACGGSGSPTGPSSLAAQALPVINANVSNNTVALTIDSSSPLSSVGSAAPRADLGGEFPGGARRPGLVHGPHRDLHAPDVLHHRVPSGLFVCPCHGLQFSTSGSVIQGPAVAPLRQYATQYANGVLSVAF